MIVVITDLDGTLLDAYTYSHAMSRVGVGKLQAAGIPLVFCSAKTRTEQRPIRDELGVTDPFIVENGSAIDYPDGSAQVLGLPADTIHQRLAAVKADTGLSFEGYADLSLEQVVAITGLSPQAADRARSRDYSETVITRFDRPNREHFQAACAAHGLKAPDGGRFMTITGAGANKGAAVRELVRYYHQHADTVITYGIGDSPNDAPLLAAVDHPYLVQRPDGTWRDLDVPNVTRLHAVGPAGFTVMVDQLLTTL